MLTAYKETAAKRVVQEVLSSSKPTLVKKTTIHLGDIIWVFYNSSKKNEAVKLLEAIVEKAKDHFVECRQSGRGPL